jgi:hypothetical protein
MSDFVKKIVDGDLESFRNDMLYSKAGESLDVRKIEIANNLYSEQPEDQEVEETPEAQEEE